MIRPKRKEPRQVYLVGLPDSGRSTLLALLEQPLKPSGWVLEGPPDLVQRLEDFRQVLRQFRKPPRPDTGFSFTGVDLHLLNQRRWPHPLARVSVRDLKEEDPEALAAAILGEYGEQRGLLITIDASTNSRREWYQQKLVPLSNELRKRVQTTLEPPLKLAICLTKCDELPAFCKDPESYRSELAFSILEPLIGAEALAAIEGVATHQGVVARIFATSSFGFVVDHSDKKPIRSRGGLHPQYGGDWLLDPEEIWPDGIGAPLAWLLDLPPVRPQIDSPSRPPKRSIQPALKVAARGMWAGVGGLLIVAVVLAFGGTNGSGKGKMGLSSPEVCEAESFWTVSPQLKVRFAGILASKSEGYHLELDLPASRTTPVIIKYSLQIFSPGTSKGIKRYVGVATFDLEKCELRLQNGQKFRLAGKYPGALRLVGENSDDELRWTQ